MTDSSDKKREMLARLSKVMIEDVLAASENGTVGLIAWRAVVDTIAVAAVLPRLIFVSRSQLSHIEQWRCDALKMPRLRQLETEGQV